MSRAAIFLALCACATTHKAETSLAAASSSESRLSGTEQVQQTTRSGPETITTTVEEYAPVQIAGVVTDKVPFGRPFVTVKKTVTVDQRGPASTQTSVNAQATTETHAESKSDAKTDAESTFKPKGLLGSLLGLWPLLLAAGAAALIYFRKDALLSLVKKFIP